MRTTIETWNGSDAALLLQLNAPTVKVVTPNPDGKAGCYGFRGMAAVNLELAVGLGFTLKQLAAGMGSAVDDNGDPDIAKRALGATVDGFWNIFYVDVVGLNLADDTLRAQLTALLTQAGQSQQFIAAVLSFGYTMQSEAQQALGRPAIQSDVDAVRSLIARESALANVQQRAAAADEAARLAFMAGDDPEDIANAAQQAWEAV